MKDLLVEGRTIQQRLPNRSSPRTDQQLARSFANLMFVGNTKAALRLITDQSNGDVLRLEDLINTNNSTPQKVRDILESKHPPAQPAHPDDIIHSDLPPSVHPIVFDSLDAATIRSAALHMHERSRRPFWFGCPLLKEALFLFQWGLQ